MVEDHNRPLGQWGSPDRCLWLGSGRGITTEPSGFRVTQLDNVGLVMWEAYFSDTQAKELCKFILECQEQKNKRVTHENNI